MPTFSDSIDTLGYVPGLNLTPSMFSATQIAQAELLIASSIASYQPTLDVSPSSSIYDLVVRPAALEYLLSRAQTEAALATGSIQGIIDNPTLANSNVLDAILSKWQIKRKTGSTATGYARINVSANIQYQISSAMVLTSPTGLQFKPQGNYIISSTGTASGSYLQLFSIDSVGSQYYFILPIMAVAPGTASQLADQIPLSISPSISNLISCFTFGAMSGAANAESNVQLINRIPNALSARNLASKAAAKSQIGDQFPFVSSIGVAGSGDAYMIRGGSTLIPMKSSGFVDLWVRTTLGTETKIVSAQAIALPVLPDGSIPYSCVIEADDYPGHYLVASVSPPSGDIFDNYPITSQIKSIVNPVNDIQSLAEGVYSRYQQTTVYFTVAPTSIQLPGVNPVVNVTVLGIPAIDVIQDFVLNDANRTAGGDYLVRAAVPCFVAMSPITVYGDGTADGNAIQTSIFNYINTMATGQALRIDEIVASVRAVPGVLKVDLPIQLNGRIFAPDGTVIDIVAQNTMAVPDRPSNQVVPETVAFYAALDDIPVNLIQD